MSWKERLIGKKLIDSSVSELKKLSRRYNIVFWMYSIMALIMAAIFFTSGAMSFDKLGAETDISMFYYLMLLNIIITSLIFGMILILWFISESSYYKMLQNHCDLLIYLKGKLGE